MNNAEGSGVSNVRRAYAAIFIAASLMALSAFLFNPLPTHADFVIIPKPWLSATHAGVTVNDAPPTPTVNGTDLTAVNGNWDITILKPANSQPSGTQGFYAIFRGTYGAMETQGSTPVSGVDYSLVDANVPIGGVSTNHITFTLPALGNSSTPSDTYTIVAGYFPTSIGVYDPATDTGIDRPTTEADIAHWFADPYDPDVNFPISWISMLPFNYVSGTASTSASCSQNCESNVLFIPGTESSRLYQKPAGSGEQQLWEPNAFSNQPDVQQLDFNADGTSKNPIYTKADGAIDAFGFAPLGLAINVTNVYKTFLQQLAGLKASSTIADYLVFPYDWRFSPEDVVNKGTQYDDGTHYIDQELIALAATSQTGKVTIIAHSNGGLVTKALMIKLAQEGKAQLVDKIIFVDVPQLGAAKDIAVMLNGDLTGIPGFVVSQANARTVTENMPDAYDLLPSAAYFAKIATPVVDLSAAPALQSTAGFTTSTITSSANFDKFITGAGGRHKPDPSDIEIPDVLSSALLASSTALHNDLDSWQPPAGVQVIQIAGWGYDTPSEVLYSEISQPNCAFAITCTLATSTRHTVNMTEDGDGTVVTASAAATINWPTYYINIKSYNGAFKTNFSHADITEIPALQNLLNILLASSSPQVLPTYVTTTQPSPTSADKTLRLRVLSPVTLDVYDSQGNHTGMIPNPSPYSNDLYIEQQIPGSYYQQYGEGQYIGLPASGTYTIKLHGTGTGTFTFEITPVSGGVAGTPITFAGVPVTASSSATMTLSSSNPASSTLTVDEDGDGKNDMTIASSTQTTDPLSYTKLIFTTVLAMDIGLISKVQIEAKLFNAGYLIAKSTVWDSDDSDPKDTNTKLPLKARVLNKLNLMEAYVESEVTKPASKRLKGEQITPAQGSEILAMIEELKTLVNAKL